MEYRKYVHSFNELNPGDSIVLMTCVSFRDRKKNLLDQELNLRAALSNTQTDVIGVINHIGQRYSPYWITDHIPQIRKLNPDWILAESVDRFIRNRKFHSQLRPNLQPTVNQLGRLAELVYPIKLITHLHPNALPTEIRSYQRKRGQAYKSKGGRPKSKKTLQMEVINLFHKGFSIRDISQTTGVPKSTICRWIKLPFGVSHF